MCFCACPSNDNDREDKERVREREDSNLNIRRLSQRDLTRMLMASLNQASSPRTENRRDGNPEKRFSDEAIKNALRTSNR